MFDDADVNRGHRRGETGGGDGKGSGGELFVLRRQHRNNMCTYICRIIYLYFCYHIFLDISINIVYNFCKQKNVYT